MFSNRSRVRWFLAAHLIFNIFFLVRLCSAQGFAGISYAVAPNRTMYTYVFSGQIMCHNSPCANAKVDVDLVTSAQGAIAQSTRTGEDGRYQLEISVSGTPEDSSLWKLEAHSAGVSSQASAQAEGRIIFTEDQKTVVVNRSLLLTQA